MQEPTAIRGGPWKRAAWLVQGMPRGQLRKVLRFFGLDTSGEQAACAARLLAARPAHAALAEAALAAALAALVVRLRLHALDALPAALLYHAPGAPPAEVPKSKAERRATREAAAALYSRARLTAAPAPAAAAAAGAAASPGRKRPQEQQVLPSLESYKRYAITDTVVVCQ